MPAEQLTVCDVKRQGGLRVIKHLHQQLPLLLAQGVADIPCLHLSIRKTEPRGLSLIVGINICLQGPL